ncbi:hypothetical protein ESCO_003645 [Escovopsis weberi]|uniref:Uncharacterized protein n=1 Tax=Escovopsis weberi TaxID=150374 RepID=A0A0M9VX23_ESCWE|nr:hypothetical protein ESCO_003645 [Escovopsis weberi]
MREDKTGSLAQLAGVSPSFRFDPVSCTLSVLEHSLVLRVASCHENFEAGEKGPTLGGWFSAPWEFGLGYLGHLTVSAEGVWQLLSRKLSSAEKMMASFVIAVTLVHEFMHVWNRATMEWLCNPAYYGIDNPQDLRYCDAVKAILLPVDRSAAPEPFYKDDYRSELGAAFETHMIGSGIYGAMSGPGQLRPPFLRQYYGMAVTCENNNGEELVKPKSRMGAHWISYERHSSIKKMFSKAYWDVVVAKYGSPVLRYRTAEPRKAFLTEEHNLSYDQTFAELSFWSQKDREWLANFMAKLYHGGQQVLYRYCTLLVHDAHRFEFLLKKFVTIADRWSHNNKGIVNRLKALLMTVLEARIYYLCVNAISSSQFENPRLSTILDVDLERRPEAEEAWRRWCELEASVPAECQDEGSRKIKNLSFNLFYLEIAMQDDAFDERIVTKMMDVAILLDSEQQLSESMLCELYHLPTALWKNYLDGFPGHSLVWTARCHRFAYFLRHTARELFAMRSHLPSIGRGWMGRLKKWVEGFETVIDLMPGNTDKVAENWSDLLRTVPMMRKSQRRPWERLFPVSKQAMLNLTGAQLKDMAKFQKKFQESMQLNNFKVVLPSKDPSAQGLAEHWAGILGTIVSFEREQQQLMATLGRQLAEIELRRGVRRAEADRQRGKKAEEAAAGRLSQVQPTPSRKFNKQFQDALTIKSDIEKAFDARRERKLKYRSKLGLASPCPSGTPSPLRSGQDPRRSPMHNRRLTLRWRQGGNQPGPVAARQAHIGVPRIAQPLDPLTGPSSPGVPSGSDTRHSLQRMTAPFSSPQAQPVFTNARDLAIHAAVPTNNHRFLPAGNVHRPVPASYQIDGPRVIDELVTGVARDIEDMAAAAGPIEAASQEAFAVAHQDMERHAAAHSEALAAAVKMHHVARDHVHRERRLAEELREAGNAAGDSMDLDGDVAMGEGAGPQPSRMVKLCDKYPRR